MVVARFRLASPARFKYGRGLRSEQPELRRAAGGGGPCSSRSGPTVWGSRVRRGSSLDLQLRVSRSRESREPRPGTIAVTTSCGWSPSRYPCRSTRAVGSISCSLPVVLASGSAGCCALGRLPISPRPCKKVQATGHYVREKGDHPGGPCLWDRGAWRKAETLQSGEGEKRKDGSESSL